MNRPRWENCVSASEEMIRWHEATNLPLFSWSSQAGGFFSGRFSEEDTRDTEMVEVYYSEANWERYSRAKQLANQKVALNPNFACLCINAIIPDSRCHRSGKCYGTSIFRCSGRD